jgi:hypothetical protein
MMANIMPNKTLLVCLTSIQFAHFICRIKSSLLCLKLIYNVNNKHLVCFGFEVLMAVTLKSTVFRVVTQYSLERA